MLKKSAENCGFADTGWPQNRHKSPAFFNASADGLQGG
jgi:hypothetical protein